MKDYLFAGINFLAILMNSIYLSFAMQRDPTPFVFVVVLLIVLNTSSLLFNLKCIFKGD